MLKCFLHLLHPLHFANLLLLVITFGETCLGVNDKVGLPVFLGFVDHCRVGKKLMSLPVFYECRTQLRLPARVMDLKAAT